MPIIPEQIRTIATLSVGVAPEAPLYEGDSYERVILVSEGVEPDGTPIEPADFTGWGAEIVMEDGDELVPTVDTPLDDTGQIVIRVAVGESTDKVGQHRGNLRIFTPVPPDPRTAQRTLYNIVFSITEQYP